MPRPLLPFLLLGALLSATRGVRAAEPAKGEPLTVLLTEKPDRVSVEIGGKPFTEYRFRDTTRPYFYPILAPDGTQLNRDYPVKKDTPGEPTDHPHHRSLWFSHGSVNGVDFWTEGQGKGQIVHERIVEAKGGPTGLLVVEQAWQDSAGQTVCTSQTTVRFSGTETERILDHEITLLALPDKELILGDTKEGTLALRLAPWMTPTHGNTKGLGRFVNDSGVQNAAAWGKRSAWVDYQAPFQGKTYGVAIFDHPSNLRHPTWWHVRDYGLFAVNPFGLHDFEGKKNEPKLGQHIIPAGGSLTLRHRFLFHFGNETDARVAGRFQDYAAGK